MLEYRTHTAFAKSLRREMLPDLQEGDSAQIAFSDKTVNEESLRKLDAKFEALFAAMDNCEG